MPQRLRSTLFAMACIALACGSAADVRAADCRQAAVERLRLSAPGGYAVYRLIKDKAFFLNWLSCDDAQFGLPTAVHESAHYISAETDAFPLVGGGEVRRPHEVTRFFVPSRIAGRFKTSDFVSTYLRRGGSSSATDFLYLLDELNAYTHDLGTAVSLKEFRHADEEVSHRDGLAALMAFVATYAQTAEESDAATWEGLRRPKVANVVSELWTRAEIVMTSSCGIPGFGTEDRTFLRYLCQAKPQAALTKLLGRAAVCPTTCLLAAPKTAFREAPLQDPTRRVTSGSTRLPDAARGVRN